MGTGAQAYAVQPAIAVLRPHPDRADWFVIPGEWLPDVAAAPAVQIDKKLGPIVHRSHLPVLAQHHREVENFLSDLGSRARLDSDRNSDRTRFDAETLPLGWQLRPYQHVGREFIRDRRGTLLADQMRLGKTSQIISAHDPDSGPLVVVAPLATREVWLSWFKRRWPDVRPVVLSGKSVHYTSPKAPSKPRKDRGYTVLQGDKLDLAALAAAQLVFVNYDILAGWQNFGNRRIGTLVFDEAHHLSNRKARRSRAALFLAGAAEQVIAASGTPLWNKPVGLYGILSCLNPGAWGKYYEFAKRYADGRDGPHGFVADGCSCEEELRLRLREVMIRRTWQDVVVDLPPITRTVETVDVSEAEGHKIELEAERVRNHARHATAVGALARFRRLLARLKIDGAIDAAQRVLQGGERVVVWSWHRDIALKIEDVLAKQGFPGFIITGNTRPDTRDAILDQWRTAPASPLVITLAVGQVGIDLSAARHAVFAELDFTPSIVAQAEMRTFSATRPMAVTYIIVDHEVDRKILDVLQAKCETASRLGVPAAETAIDVLTQAFSIAEGSDDLQCLTQAVMSDQPDINEDDDYHGALWEHDWEAD